MEKKSQQKKSLKSMFIKTSPNQNYRPFFICPLPKPTNIPRLSAIATPQKEAEKCETL